MGNEVLGHDPFRGERNSIWQKPAAHRAGSLTTIQKISRCSATTQKGVQCKRKSLTGSSYCSLHHLFESPPAHAEKVDLMSETAASRSASPETPPPAPNREAHDYLTGEIKKYIESLVTEVKKNLDSSDFTKIDEHFIQKKLHEAIARTGGKGDSLADIKGIVTEIFDFVEQILKTGVLDKTYDFYSQYKGMLIDEVTKTVKSFLYFLIQFFMPPHESVTDEFGFDEEYAKKFLPFFSFMYTYYWRVKTIGIDNIPAKGRALLVVNHSGTIPWDATMVGMSILKEHPQSRYLRCLMLDLFATMPFFNVFFTRLGQIRACPENGYQLLSREHLVAVFPEGLKGIGKLYAQRYQIQRFGRGGVIKLAIKAKAPIIPVAVVGGEEIYPLLFRADWLAKKFGFPYFPITITFPWLGLLGLIPLPSKWVIEFGKPIAMDKYRPEQIDDDVLIHELNEQVRTKIQGMIYENLKKRSSVFWG